MSVKISTDKSSYSQGEQVQLVLTVTNISGHVCIAHYPGQEESARRDINAGSDNGAGWSADYCAPPTYNEQPTTEPWGVRQERLYAVVWDQSNPRGDIADRCAPNHSPPGEYFASGAWFGAGGRTDPVSADQVTFTIQSS